jgi:SPP1 gp7 family putative phage head morphogenesis protein
MKIAEALHKLVELVQRPGLLGLIGQRRERACTRDLSAYFRLLAEKLPIETLSQLASGDNAETALHATEVMVRNVLRVMRPILDGLMATHLLLAYQEGWKTTSAVEAERSGVTGGSLDRLGQTGQNAADYAAEHAGSLIADLDATTLARLQAVVAEAIEERLGVDVLARNIRAEVMDMSVNRARSIATTEMNKAMSQATLDKLAGMEVEYKQWLPVADPCPICSANADQGAIPVDEDFDSGDAAPPAHPNCRCAVAGARPPR